MPANIRPGVKGAATIPAAERFWPRVDKSGDCWMWTGGTDHRGYGNFFLNGRAVKAHRAAWILTFGPIAKSQVLCHRCDIPLCVNPAHLFLGTQKDNIADMFKKGRSALQKNETHCRRGHPFNGERKKGGRRICRECHAIHHAEGTARKVAAYRAVPAVRDALNAAADWMRSNPPANGWGCLDHGADAERAAIMAQIDAVLAMLPPTPGLVPVTLLPPEGKP